MRILFISTMQGQWGGSEWLWADTALKMAKDGHAVGFYLPRPKSHPSIDALVRAGARAYVDSAPMPWHQRWRHIRERRDYPKYMFGHFRPELVVFSQSHHCEGPVWTPQLAEFRTPYVIVCHTVTHAAYLKDDELDRLGAFFSGARRAYFVSFRSRTMLEQYIGQAFPGSQVVRNPFRVPYDAPFQWPQDSEVRLAMPSRLEPDNKGHDILFEVLSRPHWRERPLWLHLYGEGNNERRLRRLQAMLGLERVVFEGHASDVSAIWRRCQVVAMPSREEGLPIAMVEGMLMGRPVFGTAVAGIPEFVEDGVTGFIARAADVELLDAALERLWAERGRLEAMGRASQIRARSLTPADPIGVFADELIRVAGDSK